MINFILSLLGLYPVECSWCGKIYKYKTVEHSSGICPMCKIIQLKDL